MENKPEMFDWNTLSLDQMAEYLKEKYRFSSTGESKCIHSLIEFYEKNKVEKPKAKPLVNSNNFHRPMNL
jgi:hypothetical protein